MGFRDRQKAVPLGVGARVCEARVGAVRLSHRTFVPEPAPRDRVLAVAHRPVVANDILIVFDWRNGRKLASESTNRATCQSAAPGLIEAGNQIGSAKSRTLDVKNVHRDRIDLRRSQVKGSRKQSRGRRAVWISWEILNDRRDG